MNGFKRGILVLTCLILVFGKLVNATEIEEFEALSNADSPARKEFDNHTETCFKFFKSSMVKLAVLFLDPRSESNDSQQESKCWIKCMLEQFKFIQVVSNGDGTTTGEIDQEKIMEKTTDLSQTTRTKLSQIIMKCDEMARSTQDICKKAFAFAKCVFETYRGKIQIPVIPVVPVSAPAVVVTG